MGAAGEHGRPENIRITNLAANEHSAVKRSVTIAGHRTSVSLEPEFWERLREIAAARGVSLSRLIGQVDADRTTNLSSALRVFVLGALSGRAAGGNG